MPVRERRVERGRALLILLQAVEHGRGIPAGELDVGLTVILRRIATFSIQNSALRNQGAAGVPAIDP